MSVRTGAEVRDAAKGALETNGWEMAEFLIACLRAVADKPTRLLAVLAPYRQARPKGRPRRTPDATE